MKKSWVMSIVIAGIIVVAGALWFVANNQTNNSSPPATTPTNPPSSSTNSTHSSVTATITYSNNGFSPAVTTVNSGDTVAITNNSASDLQFNSNPHPVHTDDADLNVGTVSAGQTKTFTVTKKGSFGYHNHLSPQVTGKIIIN